MAVRMTLLLILTAEVVFGQTKMVRTAKPGPTAYEDGGTVMRTPSAPLHPLPFASDGPSATFTVTTTNDTGAGSIRKAITDANASPGLDRINFSIGTGSVVIYPKSPLPQINSPVIIDGATQPGYTGVPLITIDGNDIFVAADGLALLPTAAGSTIRGLVVSFFPGQGILINANACVVEGCYVGTTTNGAGNRGNSDCGVFVQDASGCRIGGTTPSQRNVLSGNGQFGIIIRGLSSLDTISGNYIGTDATGSYAIGNSWDGVRLNIYTFNGSGASNCLVGGTTAGARNIISGNDSLGVGLNGQTVTNNRIIGNYIGTNATGTVAIANGLDGVSIRNAPGNTTGSGSSNSIGAPSVPERNIISGNGRNGVSIIGGPSGGTGNRILGNFIGTNVSGTVRLPNARHGVHLTTTVNSGSITNTRIGGASSDSANVISGNTQSGVALEGQGVTKTAILGNRIGLKAVSADTLGNAGSGVRIVGSPENKLGGLGAGAPNTIGGNGGNGVDIIGSLATGNVIEQNYIGTDAGETNRLGNRGHGVWIKSSQGTIGGISPTQRNVIAFNENAGVRVDSGDGNLIRYNTIVGNRRMGIDLDTSGVTRNDSLDSDVRANFRQNFPILDSISVAGNTTRIYGHLDSKPNWVYTIDVFSNDSADGSHFGEGNAQVAEATGVRCDQTGFAQFSVTIPVPLPLNSFFTATATDSLGNTSEFSQALSGDSDGDGIFDSWETQNWGIDVNSDSLIDYDLYEKGARPNHKDIFVEVDAMAGYGPPVGALDSVRNAFALVNKDTVRNPDGKPGIKLHVEPDNYNMQVWNFPQKFTNFKTVKDTAFGTSLERSSANARYILAAKKLVYRYCIFAKTYGVVGDDVNSSGLAEDLLCDDFMVTFGSIGANGWNNTRRWQDHAGTFMHELGHTLGLHHGGNDDLQYKINYISVMNYLWQKDYKWIKKGSWNLNYSLVPLPMLDEMNLDETRGLNPPAGAYRRIMSFPFIDGINRLHWGRLAPGVAVDWNGNGDSTDVGTSADLNWRFPPPVASPGEMMTGFADWSALRYNFRNTASFGTVLTRPNVVFRELTFEMADSLDRLPPPVPGGMFQMDGQLDTTATLVSSNGGVNFYATRRGPQLYVATTSAQAQGGDVMIFLTKGFGALKPAPWQKGGQVASWDAVLVNESTTNVPIWLDADAVSISGLVVNSASGFLEGVVDLDLFFGEHVNSVYVALGRYSTENGGGLLVQVPTGNGDGNIDSTEFLVLTETPLPIQLASFTATPLPNARVRLDWVTLSEVNNYGFEIQRKRTGDAEFQTVSNSFVPGHGTTNEPHSYSFIDTTASSGQWSYRLKQIDLDGTVHYGPEVVVDILAGVEEGTLPTVFALYQNYPNPFNPTTSIRFDVPRLSHVNLTVYNMLGQEVMTLVNEQRKPGNYEASFNASFLSSGVYFYKLRTDGYVSTKKMILTK